jgi:hypothetical protein
MDRIINWLSLIIIFVFDPLAISLVIAANFAFEKIKPTIKSKSSSLILEVDKKPSNDILPEIKEKDNELTLDVHPTNWTPIPNIDTNNDGVIDSKEIIQHLTSQLNTPNLSSWRRTKIQNQINNLQSPVNHEEDTIKIY